MRVIAAPLTWLLSGLILAYRYLVSPLLGTNCRFEPSCSRYGLEAIRRHGPFVGSWLTLKRILRCHPWGGCGYDPVPERGGVSSQTQQECRAE
ncbi:membrane protein insertion efficiency factor YidD [Nisaea acidiphila]|uniref:Putative membrane protein insertion efficiency factor n=1 Tax=Nisaea acidiphila TaxID=1862145 RepID=A0A9J7B194_9PROT|nr:membrane protein insertion efficiency factor YidD [Nisaea acidiphila]UUX52220.1 membrane protein insertion efficiency factor YidD [Nisaea acidiphila]